jgi:hypothetical protein
MMHAAAITVMRCTVHEAIRANQAALGEPEAPPRTASDGYSPKPEIRSDEACWPRYAREVQRFSSELKDE